MKRGGKMVPRWVEVYEKIYQSYDQNIQAANSMNIRKLSHGDGINSYTWNSARKTRRLIADSVEHAALAIRTDNGEVLEIYCLGHL